MNLLIKWVRLASGKKKIELLPRIVFPFTLWHQAIILSMWECPREGQESRLKQTD